MRLSSLLSVLGAAALGAAADSAEAKDDGAKPTVFDGIEVPPLLNLTPKNFEEVLNGTKYLFVKHYSPYCHHCAKFAPAFQKVYEYYYTEKTEDSAVPSAERFGLAFGQINCVAYYDLCASHNIQSYPTTVLYGDGEVVVEIKGVKNGTILTHHVEGALDRDFPGVRPAKLLLPADGEHAHPKTEAEAGEILDKAAIARMDKEKAEKAEKTNKTKDRVKADIQAKGDKLKAASGKAGAAGEEQPKAAAETGTATAGTAKDATSADSTAQHGAAVPGMAVDPSTEKVIGASKDDAVKTVAESRSVPGKGSGKGSKKGTPSQPLYRGPSKPATVQNPSGASVPLTAETFQSLVTMSQDPWFIKFYAPWCHHCKAMAANWAQLAREMQGKLNVGEVNCDKESRLCKDVHVSAYPTLALFRGGERIDYDGLRGLGDFVEFGNKAVDIVSGVADVDAAAFEALEATNEVLFLYFYDFATTSEDFMALERLPLSLIGRAKLVKTSDPALYERYKITTWPRLVVSREGRPTYYQPLTPHEMRDTNRVLNWMKSVWLPIVPELTASNAREIMDGKIVVLGILKRDDAESFASATREMKSAASEWMEKQVQLFQLERQELRDAKQLRIEEAEDRNDQRALRAAKNIRVNMDRSDKKEVTFAWVDGAFWQRWVRTTYGIDIKDGERVIINDEDSRRYWDMTSTGNPIQPSRTSILETLNKITASPPKIKAKLTISAVEKMFFDIRMTFSEHPYLSIGCVLGMSLGIASWLRTRVRRGGRGHFRLDDSVSMREFKLPTLGSGLSTGGKND